MNTFKDEELHQSFFESAKVILNNLNDKLDSQTKEIFSHIDEPGVYTIFRKYFLEISSSPEIKKFRDTLVKEEYKKNFSVPVGTINGLSNMTFSILIEGIFVNYVKNNGIVWKQDILEKYYEDLEIFLIDDKVRIKVITPIIGLNAIDLELKINGQLSIQRLLVQRKVRFQPSTDFIKYTFAAHDLKYEFFTEKIYEKIPENNEQRLWKDSSILIQQFLMVLRLYHGGFVGYLDSHLTNSILTTGQTWQNPSCGLRNNWNFWTKKPYVLTLEEVSEINRVWTELSKIDYALKNYRFLRFAIDRFMTSYERELDEDRLLDLIISLEALFQDDIDELKFRLSIRTASFLEKENSKKNKIFKTILEGYKIRSKTAHGKDISKISIDGQEITLVELTDRIEQYVRQSILEFIRRINQGEKRDDMMKTLDNDLFL